MRVAVIGNGPSAKGHGAQIDACGFVVRMNAWWNNGAANAGVKCDATAWFGTNEDAWDKHGPDGFDHWRTWSDEQYSRSGPYWMAVKRFFETFAKGRIAYRLLDCLHAHVKRSTVKDPSTGIIAIAVAMNILPVTELVLYGFDGTTLNKPHYHDARPPPWVRKNHPHDQLREKRVIAEIFRGKWLGEPCETKLIWPDMPEGVL